LLAQALGPFRSFPEAVDPEARHGDVRLVAVLLEEHPLKGLGAGEAVVRKERGPFGQVEQNGVGLRQSALVVELEGRDASVRVDGEEPGRPGLAAQDVLLDQLEATAELRQQEADLVPVAGGEEVVEPHGRPSYYASRVAQMAYLLAWKDRGQLP